MWKARISALTPEVTPADCTTPCELFLSADQPEPLGLSGALGRKIPAKKRATLKKMFEAASFRQNS